MYCVYYKKDPDFYPREEFETKEALISYLWGIDLEKIEVYFKLKLTPDLSTLEQKLVEMEKSNDSSS